MAESGGEPGAELRASAVQGDSLAGSPIGLHRVLEPAGTLPQAAYRLDNQPDLWDGEVRVRLECLRLDPALHRHLFDTYGSDPVRLRAGLLEIGAERGKLQHPLTTAGGTLTGTVDAVGGAYAAFGGHPGAVRGRRIATLGSLNVTPIWVTDVSEWDGASTSVPASGHAIVFARTPVALLPEDLELATVLHALEVAGTPALVARQTPAGGTVAVIGGAGRSGALTAVAARAAGAGAVAAVVGTLAEVRFVEQLGAADAVVTDANDPVATAEALHDALGGAADLTVVCSQAPGAVGGALLATRARGTVVFPVLAGDPTDLTTTAEGLGADLTLLVGTGYVRGHAELVFDLLRQHPQLYRQLQWHAGAGPDPTRTGEQP